MRPALSHPPHRLYLTAKERQSGGKEEAGNLSTTGRLDRTGSLKRNVFGFTGVDLISHQMWTTCVFRAQGGGLLYGFWAHLCREPASP